ncbi:hypothetical protein ACFLW9_03445 [Chloroflexota bacterium]
MTLYLLLKIDGGNGILLVMRQLELNILNKLTKDFPKEIDTLEKATDVLVSCIELLSAQSPFLRRAFSRQELIDTDAKNRCETVQIMLLMHSVTYLKAARQLLLTGYLTPSMSCARTAYESSQTADICSTKDGEAMKFLQGKHINKKAQVVVQVPFTHHNVQEIKRILSEVGVHPNYLSLENQAIFEGAISGAENTIMYEFLFLRCLRTLLAAQSDLLIHFIRAWPHLVNAIPGIRDTASLMKKVMDDTLQLVNRKAEEGGLTRHWPS